ncbi:hypothetical protein CFBP4215_05052 [Pseudomonas syringae pv. syringae]|nr:hypothetical protein CFBP4215_05052 [Pseudomonas syringae pv. syringae]
MGAVTRAAVSVPPYDWHLTAARFFPQELQDRKGSKKSIGFLVILRHFHISWLSHSVAR